MTPVYKYMHSTLGTGEIMLSLLELGRSEKSKSITVGLHFKK